MCNHAGNFVCEQKMLVYDFSLLYQVCHGVASIRNDEKGSEFFFNLDNLESLRVFFSLFAVTSPVRALISAYICFASHSHRWRG